MNIHSLYRIIFSVTRKQRMRRFENTLHPTHAMRVVDVGGTTLNWQYLPAKPHVVLVNVAPGKDDASTPLPEQFEYDPGDGRQLTYANGQFDIAYSNSVIEHVGTFDDQRAFAREMSRVGEQMWVQTPAREFPIEPHFLAPVMHWLPKRWQHRLVRWVSLRCWLDRECRAQAGAMVDEIRLLNYREMSELFPDCEIVIERFMFLPKSYIAVRRTAKPARTNSASQPELAHAPART